MSRPIRGPVAPAWMVVVELVKVEVTRLEVMELEVVKLEVEFSSGPIVVVLVALETSVALSLELPGNDWDAVVV